MFARIKTTYSNTQKCCHNNCRKEFHFDSSSGYIEQKLFTIRNFPELFIRNSIQLLLGILPGDMNNSLIDV